jgi:NCAIR mutase (PurE)-related protein
MNVREVEKLLNEVKTGKTSVEQALSVLKDFPYTDLGFARIDNHRELRTGYPEIIYCAGKTIEQVREIFTVMAGKENNVIGTRANNEMYEAVKNSQPDAVYYPMARIMSLQKKKPEAPESFIAVITAGTSDMPVAEEAAITAELLGNKVLRIYDAGVAGIHRLVDKLPEIRKCRVVRCPCICCWRARRQTCDSSPDKRWIRCQFRRDICTACHADKLLHRGDSCKY